MPSPPGNHEFDFGSDVLEQRMASHVVGYIRENGISEGPQGRISFQ
ncbi:MAG: hypothetical protein ACPGPA_03160 [Alphaproteobacteria bacterium]